MATDDPFDFLYDETITDDDHGVSISVTAHEVGDDYVQINLSSGALRIPFFLENHCARTLASMLRQAIAATERSETPAE